MITVCVSRRFKLRSKFTMREACRLNVVPVSLNAVLPSWQLAHVAFAGQPHAHRCACAAIAQCLRTDKVALRQALAMRDIGTPAVAGQQKFPFDLDTHASPWPACAVPIDAVLHASVAFEQGNRFHVRGMRKHVHHAR